MQVDQSQTVEIRGSLKIVPVLIFARMFVVILFCTVCRAVVFYLAGNVNSVFGIAQNTGGVICVSILVACWIMNHRVVIKDGVLTYTGTLGRRNTIRVEDIATAKDEFAEFSARTPFRLPFRIAIKPKPGSGAAPIDINSAVFSVPDMRRLLKAINGMKRTTETNRSTVNRQIVNLPGKGW